MIQLHIFILKHLTPKIYGTPKTVISARILNCPSLLMLVVETWCKMTRVITSSCVQMRGADVIWFCNAWPFWGNQNLHDNCEWSHVPSGSNIHRYLHTLFAEQRNSPTTWSNTNHNMTWFCGLMSLHSILCLLTFTHPFN